MTWHYLQKTVNFLRPHGYEAVRANGLGMAKDREIFEYARKNEMVIVSADLDFGHILPYTKSKKPSVIILRLKDPSPPRVNALLSNTIAHITEPLKAVYRNPKNPPRTS